MAYKPSIWSVELNQGRRDYLVTILQNATKPIHLRELAIILGAAAHEPIPEDKRGNNFHNTRYRRVITSDIRELNNDGEFPLIILTDNNGAKLCRRDEFQRLYEFKRRSALKQLAECSILARKAGSDGQTVLITADEIKSFIEA